MTIKRILFVYRSRIDFSRVYNSSLKSQSLVIFAVTVSEARVLEQYLALIVNSLNAYYESLILTLYIYHDTVRTPSERDFVREYIVVIVD
jgi:hypothetical protein